MYTKAFLKAFKNLYFKQKSLHCCPNEAYVAKALNPLDERGVFCGGLRIPNYAKFPRLPDVQQISSHPNIGLINKKCGRTPKRISLRNRNNAGKYPWM